MHTIKLCLCQQLYLCLQGGLVGELLEVYWGSSLGSLVSTMPCIFFRYIHNPFYWKEKKLRSRQDLNLRLPNSCRMLLLLSYWSSGIGAEIDTIQLQLYLRSRLLLCRAPILGLWLPKYSCCLQQNWSVTAMPRGRTVSDLPKNVCPPDIIDKMKQHH